MGRAGKAAPEDHRAMAAREAEAEAAQGVADKAGLAEEEVQAEQTGAVAELAGMGVMAQVPGREGMLAQAVPGAQTTDQAVAAAQEGIHVDTVAVGEREAVTHLVVPAVMADVAVDPVEAAVRAIRQGATDRQVEAVSCSEIAKNN